MIYDILTGLLLPPASAWMWHTIWVKFRWRWVMRFIPGWIASASWATAFSLMPPDWGYFACASLSLATAIAVWWFTRRRDRKRAASLLGEKSRALVAALVARVRESATPRPVLKPAPGGAR